MIAPNPTAGSSLAIDIERAKTIARLARDARPDIGETVHGDRLASRDPQALTRFRQALDEMKGDAARNLVALIWIGRGDFAIADWDKALVAASDITKEGLADYIEGIPLVGDYLLQGLNQVLAVPKP